MKSDQPVRISADFRERGSGVIEALRAKENVTLAERALRAGDYVLNESIVVERKTCRDFCLSIIDGRLFRQAGRLKSRAERPILLIEGTDLFNSGISIDPRCVRGALVSIAVCWYMPTVFSRDTAGTADLLETAGRQDLLLERELRVRPGRKPKTQRRRKLYILQGLPGIGPRRARALLDHFGSVEKVISAKKGELQIIPHIGGIIAGGIRNIVK